MDGGGGSGSSSEEDGSHQKAFPPPGPAAPPQVGLTRPEKRCTIQEKMLQELLELLGVPEPPRPGRKTAGKVGGWLAG